MGRTGRCRVRGAKSERRERIPPSSSGVTGDHRHHRIRSVGCRLRRCPAWRRKNALTTTECGCALHCSVRPNELANRRAARRARARSRVPARPVERLVRRRSPTRKNNSAHPCPPRQGNLRGCKPQHWAHRHATSDRRASRIHASAPLIEQTLPLQPDARASYFDLANEVESRISQYSVW